MATEKASAMTPEDATEAGYCYGVQSGRKQVSFGSVADLVAGKQTIWIPAAEMRPTVSNGCAALADVETTAGNPTAAVTNIINHPRWQG